MTTHEYDAHCDSQAYDWFDEQNWNTAMLELHIACTEALGGWTETEMNDYAAYVEGGAA